MEYTSKKVYEYISKQLNDKIVEWKVCRISWQEFPIYQSDLEFYDKVSPTFDVSEKFAEQFFEKNSDVTDNFEFNGRLKAKIPTPTLCPEERDRNKTAFINDTSLYKRKCDFSGKPIISIFSPDKPYKVYSTINWWWDLWDATDYSIKFNTDFDKSFKKLLNNVPIRSLWVMNNENSDYVNVVWDSKNCYMCFASWNLEDCLYMRYWTNSSNCVDGLFVQNSQHCYNCVQVSNCFNLLNSDFCNNCSDSAYLYNCKDCHNCFNCFNLSNKSFCIENVQYSEQEYEKIVLTIKKSELTKNILWCQQQMSENSFGNSISNCDNCSFVSNSNNCTDSKYLNFKIWSKNSYDSSSFDDHCIFSVSCPNSYNSWYNFYWRNVKKCRYCSNCISCSNCFGCVWLKNKEYCIYNKQYTKEEYDELVPQIIAQMMRDKQWWEFFSPQLSYYGYNESVAMDLYEMSKLEAKKYGYKWSDYESPMPNIEKMVQWKDLPKQWCRIIKEKKPEILEKILNYWINCEISWKPFRITKQEIVFYVKHNISLPTKHRYVRHKERLQRTSLNHMILTQCKKCWNPILSIHKNNENVNVLCEDCFESSL